MKKLLFFLLVLASFSSVAQTYNPSLGTVSNKAYSPAQAAPTDGRSKFYDATNFVYRAYVSTAEVLSYLNLSKYRSGQFDIIVNTGGTLSNGVITGGTNDVYWFRNGTADGDLVKKGSVVSVNGQEGVIVAKNADSLIAMRIDTSSEMNDGYTLAFDSTNRKWVLTAPSSGTELTPGTGMSVTDGVIAALTTDALWNAIQLRGRNISTTAPDVNQILKWDGTNYTPSADNAALDTAYYANDTLVLVASGDTSQVHLVLTPVYDNWGTQSVVAAFPFEGAGLPDDTLKLDTTSANGIATNHDIDSLQQQIDAIVVPAALNIINATATGDTLSSVSGGTATIKRIEAGANVTITPSADKLVISSTPGTAEVNTLPYTWTAADSSATIAAGTMIDYILVKPASNLTAFKVGTQSDDDAYITATPVQADADFQILIAPIHLASSGKLYFSGITSSTQIKIIKKPLHE
jgi:hypothetical protein